MKRKRKMWKALITGRTAVVIIVVLTVASAAGWIFSEIIPNNITLNEDVYRVRWGNFLFNLVNYLRLYDPFHSFWYRGVLAFFTLSLLLCIITGWKALIVRSFRFSLPSILSRTSGKTPAVEINWSKLARSGAEKKDIYGYYKKIFGRDIEISAKQISQCYNTMAVYLKGKRYHVKSRETDDGVLFSAMRGRWHYPGNMLFHIALLIITIGGMLGSFQGKREIMYARKGDVLTFYGSPLSIRIDRFNIIQTSSGEISNYITKLSLLNAEGDSIQSKQLEVNNPARYGGYDIYQSSYYVDDKEFEWARISCRFGKNGRTESISIKPGQKAKLPSTGWIVEVKDYSPDFRRGPETVYSASRKMLNPALRIEISGSFGRKSGWLFLKYPSFNSSFELPVKFSVDYIEPVYYTGLQISSNPGTFLIITGIFLAVIGLLLLFGSSYRLLKGKVEGKGLYIIIASEGGAKMLKREVEGMKEDLNGILRDIVIENPTEEG